MHRHTGPAGISPGPFVFFRVAFGVLMLWEVGRYFAHGWIGQFWIEPDFAFKYWGFSWVEPWPGPGLYLHFAFLGACAVGIALGAAYRFCAWGFAVGFTYVFLLDQATYLNHFYLICWLSFWMACLSPHRWRSVDARRAGWDSCATAPHWWLTLLRVQVAAVYIYAGIAKLDSDWLSGVPLALWIDWPQGWPVFGIAAPAAWAPALMAKAGLAFDLLVVPALLWKPTRKLAFGATLVFHLANAWLFPIGVFPWLMIAATGLFLPPDWFRPLVATQPGRRRAIPDPTSPRLGWALATILGLQLLVPLRHHLYPGDVAWTEEGHRFSWRMMLRDKQGTARFLVAEADGRNLEEVDPALEIEPWQAEEMSTRPDMILQFAFHLAQAPAESEASARSVYARVSSTLNGRDRQLLIDPQLDLAAQPRSLAPARWILPSPRDRRAVPADAFTEP